MLARRRIHFSTPQILLARVSGLPGTAIQQVSSNLCELLQAIDALEQELAAARAELVEGLHGLIRLATPEARRFLLAVKRDAFNGRPLGRHRADPRWRELTRQAGPAAERAAALDERLAGAREAYESAYRRRRAREHRLLLAVLDDAGFRRGLALASPVLAAAAGRARRSGPDIDPGRRENRLDLGLLRYVSRAALKLSPFSTLTRIALGTLDPLANDAAEPLSWVGGGWSERSLLRLRRYLIEQDLELLCRYRPFREGLTLRPSSTLEPAAPGSYRLIRPERWTVDAEAGRFRHQAASRVEMHLPDALVERVFAALAGGAGIYGELAATLAPELGGAEAAAAALDALIDAGVLLLETPWPSNEPHLEKRLLAHLRTLPAADPRLAAAIAALERVVGLEEGFQAAAEPALSVVEIDLALDDLWRAAAGLAGLAPGIERLRNKPGDVCEDVLLVPAQAGEEVVFRAAPDTVREIVRSAGPWARLTAFQGFRFDFLHTLAAFAAGRWPGRGEIGLLDLFGAAQPLWKEYRKLLASGAESWRSAFNPLGLDEVAALAGLRREIWAEIRESVRSLAAGEALPVATLEGLAARIPERYASPVGPCLFVQPADGVGTGAWVLNRIFEGTGRYGSRFTPLMSEGTRRRYAGGFVRGAAREVDGEPADLLDLMWSRRDTLNVHAAQTARVLAIPGETLDRETAEALDPRDLRVRLDGAGGLPRLVDAAGRRVLPVHLGGAACALMPFLVQFLAQWGPGEVRPLRSPVTPRREGDAQIFDRLTAGCLVLARRRWLVSLGEELRRRLATDPDEAVFAALQRWRIDLALPERLFWIEKTHYGLLGDVYKPQYLDFTSCLFVEVFRSALRLNADPLTFEEALPAASDLPLGPGDERWAVELQIDTLPLGPGGLFEGAEGTAGGADLCQSLPSASGGRFV